MTIPASRLRWPSSRRGGGAFLPDAGFLAAGYLAAGLLRELLFGLLVAFAWRLVAALPLLLEVAIAQMFLREHYSTKEGME